MTNKTSLTTSLHQTDIFLHQTGKRSQRSCLVFLNMLQCSRWLRIWAANWKAVDSVPSMWVTLLQNRVTITKITVWVAARSSLQLFHCCFRGEIKQKTVLHSIVFATAEQKPIMRECRLNISTALFVTGPLIAFPKQIMCLALERTSPAAKDQM